MAIIVTFTTTYSLILPAITVSRDQVDEIAGLYLDAPEDDAFDIVEDTGDDEELWASDGIAVQQAGDAGDDWDGILIEEETEKETEEELIEDAAEEAAAGADGPMPAQNASAYSEDETEAETQEQAKTAAESETETRAEVDEKQELDTSIVAQTQSETMITETAETEFETETEIKAETETEPAVDAETEVEDTEVETEIKEAGEETEAETEEETEAETEMLYPAQRFTASEGGVLVIVNAPESAFPEGTTMTVSHVEDEQILKGIEEAALSGGSRISRMEAVDICFRNAGGEEIEPKVPVSVCMITENKTSAEDAVVVHVNDDGRAETVQDAEVYMTGSHDRIVLTSDGAAKNQTESAVPDESPAVSAAETTAAFETEQFSIYAVVYTVDFHWEVNGKKYEFSIPGGGFVCFTDLVEMLGIARDTRFADSGDENESEITEDAEGSAVREETEENSVNHEKSTTLTLGDVEVSERTREFVTDVASVEFSTPTLVDVSRVDWDTTVGQIKESRGLECEYSADLSEEQIAEMNAQTVDAGDWALISVQPFTSEETLTVTMKNGEEFSIRVTDAQFKKTVIDAKGDTWEITVTYGPEAGIPDGAELHVEEINELDEAYETFRQKYAEKLTGTELPMPDHPTLFDISIMYEGTEIEPAKDSEVIVDIKLVRSALKGIFTSENTPLLLDGQPVSESAMEMERSVQVIHQVDQEEYENVETTDTITDEEIVSSFVTDSFSNWLVYLDEDLTDINVTTGDSITLRPYTEWVWKSTDEPAAYQGGQWTFPGSDWDTWTQNGYTYYQHKTNGTRFRSYSKNDSQLNETYTVVTSEWLSVGDFDIQTNKGKTIHVHVTQGSSSGKPGTVSGVEGLTVNLFDYDVPGNGNYYDFTKSGSLDVQSNVASNPDNNNNINTNHDLKFLGYGGSNVADNNTWFWINNYTKDVPQQGIVKDKLGADGYPSLVPGKNGQERSNPGLKYLFDPDSRNHNVYAFPNADGLFQKDNQGYYYYNSNANYAEYDRANNKFILYEHTYSQNTGGSNGSNAKPIGFFPFHEYDTVDTQPEMNFNQNLNHHFGMSMTVDFEIPKDRRMQDDNGNYHDIVYEFSGDDDLWVFVDDELVLDIGGIHQPVTGSINFTTGVITVHGVNNITKTFDVGGHTLKMFYIERGGCDSNLSVRFNLPLTKGNGKVKVAKKSLTNDTSASDQFLPNAVFGIWENPNCEGEPYKTAISDADGIVDFGELPVKTDDQKYYLKEIVPPDGYKLNSTIFTVEADGTKDSDGDYVFKVKDGTVEIEKMTQEPYAPVIRDERPTPINLSVLKQWQNADGTVMEAPDLTAEFELKRYVTSVQYNVSSTVTLNVYRVGHNGNAWDWTYPTRLEATRTYAGNSIANINWTYNGYLWDGYKSGEYRVGNGQKQTKNNNTPAQIQLPASGTLNVYIYDGNLGTDNEQYGVENISVTGIEGSSHADPVIGERTLDNNFSRTLTLPTSAGAWTDAFNNLAIQETINGTTYFYEYFIQEKTVPSGYEAVYLDGSGNPITSPNSLATNVSGSQTVVNRKLLDVPIEKYWPDFSGEEFTWTATFVLEQREIKVNDNDPDASDAVTEFTAVPGRAPMTVSKDQTPIPTFDNLPMYKMHSNGTLYRIEYSVEETAYEVRKSGSVIAKWTKGQSGSIGDLYTPQFEQDAGENGSSVTDYQIIVINTLASLTATKEMNLGVHKTWPDGSTYASDDNTYAKFVLKRYVHEEYRDYSNTDANTEWVTVTMNTDTATQEQGSRHQTLTVPKNTTLHIVGEIRGETNANKIVFSQSSGQNSIELVQDNSHSETPAPFDITFTADQDKTVTLTQGDNYVVGGRDGFRLSDTYGNKTSDQKDSSFEEHFTLNAANGWEKIFDYLSVVEEGNTDPKTGTQTIHVYSYYLEEVECNPSNFTATFTDLNGNVLGNEENRIDFDSVITAANHLKTGDLTVTKELLGDVSGNENRQFKVTIKNSDGKYLQQDQKSFGTAAYEFPVSVSDPLTITGLPLDTYTVEEKTEEGDVAITGFMWNATESTVTGSAALTEDKDHKTVELKNYYNEEYTPEPSDTNEYTNLIIDKNWIKADGSTTPADSDTIKFKINVKSADAYIPVKWDLYDGRGAAVKNEDQSGICYVAKNAHVQFTLNRYDAYATPGSGFWLNSGGVELTNGSGISRIYTNKIPASATAASGSWNTQNNTYTIGTDVTQKIDFMAQPWKDTAKWVSGTPANAGEWNLNVSVTGSGADTVRYDTVSEMQETLIPEDATSETLVYTLDKDGITFIENESSCSVRHESLSADTARWIATLSNFPVYSKVTEDGETKYKVYKYEIEEIEVNGEKVINNATSQYTVDTAVNDNTTTITNKEIKAMDLDIIKVDAGDQTKKLKGAEFTLYQVDEKKVPENQIKYKDTQPRGTAATNADGKASFEAIAPGYYEVKETKLPDGYIRSGENAFYIRIGADGVELLQKDLTKKPEEWTVIEPEDVSTEGGGIVCHFAAAINEGDNKKPAAVTVSNTPGSPLPNAGGPGTGLFTALGSLLMALAGWLLIRRRRFA